jgi:hypothetical protein
MFDLIKSLTDAEVASSWSAGLPWPCMATRA